ncbi:hypothetical protein [Variovorax sp. J22R115]|uniref:hypothetical protein n=1 Tax=Variovorax sp. J22R115 TaxID=3053509 RepID=UPI002575F073|nr:hypothetical protein [Variovorax sp. J22R115]MDM0047739.1 hypothetical protein [Variovorax sp. J22R115]
MNPHFTSDTHAIMLGEYARALPWLEHSQMLSPYWATTLMRAAAHAGLRNVEEARLLLQQAGPESAEFMRWARLSRHPMYLKQQSDHFIGPLVKCGLLPEEPHKAEDAAGSVAMLDE